MTNTIVNAWFRETRMGEWMKNSRSERMDNVWEWEIVTPSVFLIDIEYYHSMN